MFRTYLVLIFIFMFVCIGYLHADVLYLKNGRKIEGIVKSDAGITIELEVCSGSVKFDKREIEKIEKSSLKEADVLRQKCEKQKIETQNKILSRRAEEELKPKRVTFVNDSRGITINVTLNKKIDAALMLDTGSSLVVLRKDIAKKLGINLEGVKPDGKLTMADGKQINAKQIVLDSIKVENVEAQGVEAAIILDEISDAGLQDGLLGMSFLKKFNFKVDQRNKKLILEKL